ncbi:MAG: YbjN domain-containing protein [Desulfobacterales bacterium]|nr:YbjN domain-containing protein [Desulfobacterales bacterium]
MKGSYDLVKQYLYDLDMAVKEENPGDGLLIAEDEENGIKDLIIACEPPIVILEQVIMKTPAARTDELFKRLLQMNRGMVHGAFALDEAGEIILFRDTLQLENLDKNELEGSIQALGLALSEYGAELLEYAR